MSVLYIDFILDTTRKRKMNPANFLKVAKNGFAFCMNF